MRPSFWFLGYVLLFYQFFLKSEHFSFGRTLICHTYPISTYLCLFVFEDFTSLCWLIKPCSAIFHTKLKPDFNIDRGIRPYLKSFYRMEPSKLEMGSQDWEALLNVRSIKNHIDSYTIREEFNQNTSNILSGSTIYFQPLSTCLDLSTCRGNYFSRNSN